MSSNNKEFDFSDIIPLGVDSENNGTFYSWRSDAAKREIAVVAALQLINTSLSSSSTCAATLKSVPHRLPELVNAILKEMDGGE